MLVIVLIDVDEIIVGKRNVNLKREYLSTPEGSFISFYLYGTHFLSGWRSLSQVQ